MFLHSIIFYLYVELSTESAAPTETKIEATPPTDVSVSIVDTVAVEEVPSNETSTEGLIFDRSTNDILINMNNN